MAAPSDKLAQSLEVLKALQDEGVVAISSSSMNRTHRERLLKSGFIKEVMRGWYVPSRPDEPQGESTSWFASFWEFCSQYLTSRFGEDWCLGPEQSLSIHTGNWRLPKQLLVRSPKGGNKPTSLPYGTSMFDLRLAIPERREIETKSGMQIMSLPLALVNCSPGYFLSMPTEMRTALTMVANASEILRPLLGGHHSKVAGRLAGGFRNIGRDSIADNTVEAMRSAGYSVYENDPFEDKPSIAFTSRQVSPYVNRLRLSWAAMREPVLKHFPQVPCGPVDITEYLQDVEDLFTTDAYHSLSIEGYRISPDLIERVRSGNWDPHSSDRSHVDALAARGYWQAFQAVKESLKKVLGKNPAGSVVEEDHEKWYRALFAPSVSVGALDAKDLAGYRNHQVYIRASMHVPPKHEAVRDLMPAFFELLKTEDEPLVRAVLGHFFFVYIHPYMDGNGRIGRFLMNVLLADCGCPWTVIPVERRNEYMSALEKASVDHDIIPFAEFLRSIMVVS